MTYRTPAAVTVSAEDLIQFGISRGLTLESFQQALSTLAPTSEEKPTVSAGGPTYTVTVNYSLTKPQMIAVGNYDYVNDFLRDNDPVEGKIEGAGQVEVALERIHFNQVISTTDALKEIKKMGREPARLEHLLALGAKHPNLQKEFPIVALGSVWQYPHDYRGVAYLGGWDGGRRLDLSWSDDDWFGSCRFLVVGK